MAAANGSEKELELGGLSVDSPESSPPHGKFPVLSMWRLNSCKLPTSDRGGGPPASFHNAPAGRLLFDMVLAAARFSRTAGAMQRTSSFEQLARVLKSLAVLQTE
jgi:hypothetical protein